jgi:hypothetical protein
LFNSFLNFEPCSHFQILYWWLHGHFHYSTKSYDAYDEKRWSAILKFG